MILPSISVEWFLNVLWNVHETVKLFFSSNHIQLPTFASELSTLIHTRFRRGTRASMNVQMYHDENGPYLSIF